MAVKAVHITDVLNLDQVPEIASFALYSKGVENGSGREAKLVVIGHRGSGMNNLVDGNVTTIINAFKENSILSFNAASNSPIDFIEFDVQVTKDDCPIIFHDNFILSNEEGIVNEKRVTDLSLLEFMCYGPQREVGKVGKSLMRKTKEGKTMSWNVETDDAMCTLKEAFENVKPCLGFNIELKFDDQVIYDQQYLTHVLQVVLKVVFECAKDRPIMFSSFQPDAALLIKKLQSTYPVYFLTNGGNEVYSDVRRNSLEEALKLCSEGGLHGIVCEAKGIFRNPSAVNIIKNSNLSLLTYGKLNNVPEAVYLQHLMGVEGVIVDLVREITEAVGSMVKQPCAENGESTPRFSQRELSFLLKLIPELIQL